MAFDFPSAPTLGQTYTPTGGPTYVWNGTAWVVLSPGSSYSTTIFTATLGQTTFSTTYVVGAIYVYRNGVLLAPADFTATNGTSIVLANACNAGDTIEIINLAQVPYVNCVQKTGDTMTGNLNFSGNALRITGDFSNATTSNRLMFQSSTTNGNTSVGLIPNGTSQTSNIRVNNNSDTTNASYGAIQADGGAFSLISAFNGAGTYLPIAFITGGSERVRIDTSGNVGIGFTPPAWTADYKVINLNNYYGAVGSDVSGPVQVFLSSNAYHSGGSWKGGLTGSNAALYQQYGGSHQWLYATSVTNGNNFSFTEAMRIDASGNVGIGTGGTINTAGGVGLQVKSSAGNASNVRVTYGTSTGLDLIQGVGGDGYLWNRDNAPILFGTNNAERGRVNGAGDWFFGSTAYYTSARLTSQHLTAGAWPVAARGVDRGYAMRLTANAGFAVYFETNDGANVAGNIYSAGTTTAYATSSDYRLKENAAPIEDAVSTVMALRPVTFTWKHDGSEGEGFIAHELQEIKPLAVTGEKDAVDADGKPVYQGVDPSKIVATLVAAIQEQQTIIKDLKARVAQLEGAK